MKGQRSLGSLARIVALPPHPRVFQRYGNVSFRKIGDENIEAIKFCQFQGGLLGLMSVVNCQTADRIKLSSLALDLTT